MSTATSPLPTSRAPDQPSSSSSGQSSAAIAAGVGGGVAVALVLTLLLIILVVFVMRRKPRGTPQAVEKEQDRNGGSAMDNPVYTGKPLAC